jgi:predicted phosphoribosyltransferase
VRFRDRSDAGRLLGQRLAEEGDVPAGALVLGLPRGGIPVAYEVARALGVPLDVLLVRKLGVPGREELALGAVASGGVRVLNRELVRRVGLSSERLRELVAREESELERRELLYREGRRGVSIERRAVVVVDDGLATGSTMLAALRAVRAAGAAAAIVAVPVADSEVCDLLAAAADSFVCLQTPHPLRAVGLWYEDFSQVDDEQVRRLLADPGFGVGG